jgi:cytidine deaminase
MKKESELVEISGEDAVQYFSENEIKLIEEATLAREAAYAPYSNFKVGSAALLSSGEILKGNNQENAAYPSGLCAERVLLNYVKANFPEKNISVLAIITDQSHLEANRLPVPCGACLQTILETEQRQETDLKIILIGKNKYYIAHGIKQFLPFQFGLL